MNIAFLTPEYPHKSLSCSGGLSINIKNLTTSLIQRNLKDSRNKLILNHTTVLNESQNGFGMINKQSAKNVSERIWEAIKSLV